MPSRESARRLVTSRQVLVDGSFADKPARMVDGAQAIAFVGPPPLYVSRAGQKLARAFDEFNLDPAGLVCLDAGSSTGGFTDCLLQRGAQQVVAVDVGTNQLHEKIRLSDRVDVREQTDVRSLEPSDFGQKFDLIVGDLSFISLRLVLPALRQVVDEDGQLVMLIKPQFEASRIEASKGRGIISDPAVWRRTIGEVLACAAELRLRTLQVVPSSLPGSHGNVEFVAWLKPIGHSIGLNAADTGKTGADERPNNRSGGDDAATSNPSELDLDDETAMLVVVAVEQALDGLEAAVSGIDGDGDGVGDQG